MPHITVTIAGKSYRMACAEGEEAHLTALSEDLDKRIGEMRSSFGEIGDMRLHVMAALTLADELQETRRTLAALEQANAGRAAEEARIAGNVTAAAVRIDRLARSLAGHSGS